MNETSTKTPSFDGPGEGAFIMTIFLARTLDLMS
jgi:hypothetical protein